MEDAPQFDISPEELSRLSAGDRQQLQNWLQQEGQKNQVQKTVHELTETCFKKCITSTISTGKLAGKEEGCMQNCVERFMDSNLAVLRHLETLRAQQ